MRKEINYAVLSFVLLFSCSNAPKEKSSGEKERTISNLQVHLVDLDLERAFKVTCNDFEQIFKDEVTKTTINDEKKIKEFSILLKSLKKDPQNYIPDVRGKVLISFKDATIDTLCISKLGFELNGISFEYNARMINLISAAR